MVGLAGKEEEGEKDEVEEGFHVEEGNLRGCERMGEDMRGLKRMGEEGASGELVVGAVQDDGNANDGDDDAYNEIIERLLSIR